MWHSVKPLPRGMDIGGRVTPTALANVDLLRDITTGDAYGQPVIRQQIFDAVLAQIAAATDFIVLDFFLFNDQRGALADATPPFRALSSELRDALLARKQAVPDLRVLFITDPINDVYGGEPSPELAQLRAAGVSVVTTDLDQLRDSNPIYSGLWRLTIDWWAGDGSGPGWLPNPLENGPNRVTFRSWARLLNLKANHRKVIVSDDGAGGLVGIVMSANPHDASSAHSNVALRVRGEAIRPLLESEIQLARGFGWRGNLRPHEAADVRAAPSAPPEGPAASIEVLTEGAIRARIVERLERTRRGDSVRVAMFYLSERTIIESLLDAADRGVDVRVILDPNKDAFGRTKNGIPNRPVASELVASSDGAIKVRWYRTRGEQFHTKLLAIESGGTAWITAGSANFTRRNVGNFNLEANLAVEVQQDAPLARELRDYFDLLWDNRDGPNLEYTSDFATWADPKQSSYWLYRLMEASGLSSF
jgi:phosphatidylserine/phosphatidylglycerophosphate/cardiolipin synthase-like enzyme